MGIVSVTGSTWVQELSFLDPSIPQLVLGCNFYSCGSAKGSPGGDDDCNYDADADDDDAI